MQETSPLLAAISQLLASGEPLSFYDAAVATRRARAIGDLDDACLAALVDMHDAPMATDGARAVLGEFLSAYARRVAQERQRAARAITIDDHGKTVRLASGEVLTLRLRENAAAGFRWRVERAASHVRVQRVGRVPGTKSLAEFRVAVGRTGRSRLAMVEARPANLDRMTGGTSQPATFELLLAVEPATQL